ncbi:MAG TPA: hypothetical protein VEK07_05090 [Polyangiaceae bacterium]|nr:hypothetical protein [Polyangiaceae bacterium]
MKRVGIALLVGLLVAVIGAAFAACSSDRNLTPAGHSSGNGVSNTGSGAPNTADVGTVKATLLLPNGESVTSLSWTINGPNSYSGTIPIGSAQSVEVIAGGVLAGSGYTITLSGSDSANGVCIGTSNSFGVIAGQMTSVTLAVICTDPTDATFAADVTQGSVAVDAGVVLVNAPPVQCPAITSFSSSPSEVVLGQPSQLGLSTTGPSSTIQWTVSPPGGGTFVNPADGGAGANLASPQFQCANENTSVTITVTVSLPGSSACSGVAYTSMSTTITCEPACNVATDCPGTGTVCSPISCTAGLCGTQSAPEGTTCGPGDICNGEGSCVPFTFSVLHVFSPDGGAFIGLVNETAAPVSIQERLVSDGGVVSTVFLPTSSPAAGQDMVTLPAGVLIAGLSRSQDGHYLTMVGYNASLGAANPANSADTIVVARIDSSGNVDTSTQFASGAFQSLNSIRSSATADGQEFWVSGVAGSAADGGPTGGIWYIPFGTVGGAMVTPTPSRMLNVTGSQLYASGETAAGEVFAVGSGLPISSPAALTTLPGLPMVAADAGVSPWQFVFVQLNPSSAGPDTLYVADDRALNGSASMGIQRLSLEAGTWTQTAVLQIAAADGGAGPGFRGLAGIANGPGQVTLIGTTVETPTRIAVFTDDGGASPPPGIPIVVANSGQEIFRGVALSPHP